jgi:hypothetical protein
MSDVLRQQSVDSAYRVIHDVLEDLVQVGFGINAIQAGRTDRAVSRSCKFAA